MLADHLAPNLAILFCGTAAGHRSAALGHYYAGPGNKFWRLLADTGLTPRRLRPDEDHLLLGFGFGLTDLAKGVSGMDHEIPKAAFAPLALAALISRWRPLAVAFTSLTAARLGLGDTLLTEGRLPYDPRWPDVALWALQSPSGANAHFTARSWQALADWRRGLR
jgi:TDG/mug DNA glycosylase family protein